MNPLRDKYEFVMPLNRLCAQKPPQNVMEECDDRKEISANASQQRKMLASNGHCRRIERVPKCRAFVGEIMKQRHNVR
jgi:hypothetical protein